MMKEYKPWPYISVGLVIGVIVGLFLDMYQINFYGAVGLGIVFTPIIGLFFGGIIGRFLTKKSRIE